MKPGIHISSAFVVFVSVLLATPAYAAEFVPIRNYHQLSDGPFPEVGLGQLQVETFEVPGQIVSGISFASPHSVAVRQGSSVEADANGQGNALEVFGGACVASFPPQCPNSLTISFDESSFGQLPNYFGFVWTEAVRSSEGDVHPWARINITDKNGVVTGNLVNDLPVASSLASEFDDDTLISFINDEGISEVTISIVTNGKSNGGRFAIDHLQFGMAALAGDANRNGAVDFADFTILAAQYGNEAATWSEGDFNFDRTTGFLDFLELADNYGQQLVAGESEPAVGVPEPSAWIGLIVGASLLARFRRRKSTR